MEILTLLTDILKLFVVLLSLLLLFDVIYDSVQARKKERKQ